MHQFARAVGFTFLASGILLLISPEAVRRIILTRAEFALLSPGALRMLGAVYAFAGSLLVAVTTRRPSAVWTAETLQAERR